MKKLVSILIPVYNRVTIISQTIESALDQSYQHIEIIIVDNSSTDGTWEVIRQYASQDHRIRAFRNDTNIGPVRNWRRCIDEAKGFYGKILWSDDLIEPKFVEKCLEFFDRDTAFVYTVARIFYEDPKSGNIFYLNGKSGHKPSEDYISKALLGGDVPVSPGCALFRLSDLKKNMVVIIENKVDSDFAMHAIGNDLLLLLLTAKDYQKYGFLSEPLSLFRAHSGSISVSSSRGKLPLHYMIVKAAFSEKYRTNMVGKVAVQAWFLLRKYPESRDYNLNEVSDFFYKKINITYSDVIYLVIRKMLDLSFGIHRRYLMKDL